MSAITSVSITQPSSLFTPGAVSTDRRLIPRALHAGEAHHNGFELLHEILETNELIRSPSDHLSKHFLLRTGGT